MPPRRQVRHRAREEGKFEKENVKEAFDSPDGLPCLEGDGRRREPGQGAARDAQVRRRGEPERRAGEVAAHAVHAHVPGGLQVRSEQRSVLGFLTMDLHDV